MLLLQMPEQIHDLRLYRDIQRGDWFISYQEFRFHT